MEEITLEYNLTPAEVKMALWQQWKRLRLTRNIIYTVVLAALFGLFMQAIISDPTSDFDRMMMMLCGFLIIMIWLLPYLNRRRTAKAMGEVTDTFTAILRPDGISIPVKQDEDAEENAEPALPETYEILYSNEKLWIKKVNDCYVVDPHDGQLFVLPLRCFTPEQSATFDEWLAASDKERNEG